MGRDLNQICPACVWNLSWLLSGNIFSFQLHHKFFRMWSSLICFYQAWFCLLRLMIHRQGRVACGNRNQQKTFLLTDKFACKCLRSFRNYMKEIFLSQIKSFIWFKVLQIFFVETDRTFTSLNWNYVLICPLNLSSHAATFVNLLLAVFESGAVVNSVIVRAACGKVHDHSLFNWRIAADLALTSCLFTVRTGVLVFFGLWHLSWRLRSESVLIMMQPN